MSSLRASDADREEVAERLRHATAEGRLTADELDERLGALYQSRTYGELGALVADLPVRSSPRRSPVRVRRWAAAACVVGVLLAVLGMLAGTVRQSTAIVDGTGHQITVNSPGPGTAAHALFAAAASAVSAFAVLLVFAGLVWLLARSRRPSDV